MISGETNKIAFSGTIVSVKARIRLLRSFDQVACSSRMLCTPARTNSLADSRIAESERLNATPKASKSSDKGPPLGAPNKNSSSLSESQCNS